MVFEASAPGRCGIIGNPSDIYGGNVLSCTIPARAVCRLTFGSDSRKPEDTRLWDAVSSRFPVEEPVTVEWETSVPRSSGLSGSTAIVQATLAAVLAAKGCPPNLSSDEGRTQFAELARDIEINSAGIKGGYQDAYVIAHGGLRLMRFAGKHPDLAGPNGVAEPIDAPLPFLLITTGVERLSGSVHGPMIERWLAGERLVVESMERITELGLQGAEALVYGNFAELGAMMDENHRLVAALGGSGDAIDALIQRCKAHGALGAKLAGAGLGGTVIALTDDSSDLESKLRSDGYTRFLRPSVQPGTQIT